MKKIIFAVFTLGITIAHANVILLNADYSVPTLNPEELQYNTFNLENYQVETFKDGSAVMSFQLPKTMVGHDQHRFQLKLIGQTTNSDKILSSANAKAVCQGPWTQMSCSISFTKLNIDKKSLSSVLNQKFSSIEADIRFKMLLKFNTDPIGTVKVFSN